MKSLVKHIKIEHKFTFIGRTILVLSIEEDFHKKARVTKPTAIILVSHNTIKRSIHYDGKANNETTT